MVGECNAILLEQLLCTIHDLFSTYSIDIPTDTIYINTPLAEYF